MLLMIDNYDSFTYTLVNYLESLSVEVMVKKNDQTSIQEVADIAPDHLMISPGPCTPNEAGVSLGIVEHFAGQIPIFGVCLGHQVIGQVFGANVIKARRVMHGKTSRITHNDTGVFRGLPSPFTATRYHSLVLDEQSLPKCIEVTAWVDGESGSRREIMGIVHRDYAIEGVQFHPESVLTEFGLELLSNFISSNK